MSNCPTYSANSAGALIDQKWAAVEGLANESVNLAKQALAAIAGTANTQINAAGLNLSPSLPDSCGGSANVAYEQPEVPELPELADQSSIYQSGATLGYDGSGASGVSYNPPTKLGDFRGRLPNPGSITAVQTPTAPSLPPAYQSSAIVTFTLPTAPAAFSDEYELLEFPELTLPEAPAEFTGEAPALSSKQSPYLSASRPGDAPPIEVPNFPDAPTVQLPDLPPEISIPLPTLRIPDLSDLDSLLAELRNGQPEEPVFSIPDDQYLDTFDSLRSTLGSELTSVLPIEEVLTWVLSGDSIGIPAAVAQMLRDRAFATEDRLAFQAEQEGISDWLSRGFTLPGGALAAQLAGIRQKNRDKKAELNRDFWVEEAKLEIEALREAVKMGIQYQGMLWDTRLKLWGVCGDLANRFMDVQMKVLEATVAVYKAQLDAWQAEAAVIKDYISAKLQAELGKLEVTKVEAQISGLFVQINSQNVDLYKAKIEGALALVNIYKVQVDAANAKLQAESLKLEAFAKQVQVYGAAVQAYEAEWRGYATAVQADATQIEAFKAQIQAYGVRADVYGKLVDAEKTRVTAQTEIQRLQLDAYKTGAEVYTANVEAYSKQVDAERSRVTAETEIQKLGLAAYQAETQTFVAQSDAYAKTYQAEVARVQAEVEVAKLPIEIYKGEVQAYVAEADAYGKNVEAARTEVMAKVEAEKLILESNRNQLEALKVELQRAGIEVEARARVHDTQVRLFSALVESEQARVSAELQNVDQALRQVQFEAGHELKKAELEQTKVLELAKIALQGESEVARVASQLAGAALSAVNASASIGSSYSASNSSGCSTNYNYDMSA